METLRDKVGVVTGGSGATGRQIVVQGLLTLLVSLAALPLGLAGPLYFAVALVAGIGFVAKSAGIIDPRRGPWLLLAELLHGEELEHSAPAPGTSMKGSA